MKNFKDKGAKRKHSHSYVEYLQRIYLKFCAKYWTKIYGQLVLVVIVFAFGFCTPEIQAQQNDMFKQKKERKRLWRRWKPNREQFNPYLNVTKKKKTSSRIAKGTRKEMRKQKRAYKKELKRTRRKKGIPQPPD